MTYKNTSGYRHM